MHDINHIMECKLMFFLSYCLIKNSLVNFFVGTKDLIKLFYMTKNCLFWMSGRSVVNQTN